MNARPTSIPEVLVLEPRVFGDARGFFFESFNKKALEAAVGRTLEFVQDNHSLSARNVLRGIHYQCPHPQGKLVRVVRGEVFDVAVDLRRGSPTFGRWVGETLSAENKRQIWIPEGFGHGFLVVSDGAEFLYKTTDYWHPEDERCIRWDDPELGIAWPLQGATPVVSAKDARGTSLEDAVVFEEADLLSSDPAPVRPSTGSGRTEGTTTPVRPSTGSGRTEGTTTPVRPSTGSGRTEGTTTSVRPSTGSGRTEGTTTPVRPSTGPGRTEGTTTSVRPSTGSGRTEGTTTPVRPERSGAGGGAESKGAESKGEP